MNTVNHRIITILALAALIIPCTQLKASQPLESGSVGIFPASDSISLLTDEIQVTASRIRTPLPQASRIIGVLTREQISALPVQSVNDILKYAAGVDVRQRGPIGAQTDVGVRGGNFEQVAILLDGINICDPQTGHNSFDFPVDMSDIDHIEVLEGPAARAYGSSSLMGAINIVTRTDASSNARAHLEAGSWGYAAAGASASAVKGSWNNMLSVDYRRSDGYSRSKTGELNSDFNAKKIFYKGAFAAQDLQVSWHAGASLKDWGSNTFYSAKFDNQFEHTAKTFTALQAEWGKGNLHLRPSAWWNHSQDRFELIRGSEASVPFNYHRSNVVGVALNGWLDWKLGCTALGAEFRNEDLVSGNLGEPLSTPIHIKGTGRDYTLGLNRTNVSLILEHNISLGAFSASAGVVGVRNSWNGNEMRFYPGLDLSLRLSSALKVYATYNTSLRLPSVTELYYSVGGYKADKHLKPEELRAVDLGLKYADFRGVQASASLYYNHCSNMIDWIMDLTEAESDRHWQSVNFTQIKSWGAQLTASVSLETLLPGQHLLKSVDLAYNYISQEKVDAPNIQSRTTLEYLKHKAVCGLHLNLPLNLELALNGRWQERTGTFTDFDGQVRDYEPYGVLDARLEWKGSRCSLYLEGNNLTDRQYYDYGCVPQPGLWTIAGVRIQLVS
jgi:iron complex outermembrane receptor protein